MDSLVSLCVAILIERVFFFVFFCFWEGISCDLFVADQIYPIANDSSSSSILSGRRAETLFGKMYSREVLAFFFWERRRRDKKAELE